MLVFPRQLALVLSALVTFLAAVFFLSSTTPVVAATCTTLPTSGSGVSGNTITDCSEILTITQSGGNFVVTTSFPPNNSSIVGTNGFNSNGVVIGVVNNTGVAIQDLMLIGSAGRPIYNIVPSETLCFTNAAPGNCGAGGANIGTGAISAINHQAYTISGNEGLILGNGNIVYFTQIGTGNGTLNNLVDVVFDGGLPAGFTAYFALTNLAQSVCVTNSAGQCITNANEPASLFLLGGGLLALIAVRRRWFVNGRARLAMAVKNHIRLYGFGGKSLCSVKSDVRPSATL